MIYLDNNATSPLLSEVMDAMLPCFMESFGNPSSIHSSGRRALSHIKEARQQVAALLGCRQTEVLFTSGGTEGDNLALKGLMRAGGHLIISAIEHSAVLATAGWLEKQVCDVTRVAVNGNGQVDPKSVRAALRPNTQLISIMTANNETGVIQPVQEIGRIASEADVWFHTDAVQAAGKIPLSVDEIGCDLLTISGHKFHGPQGTGALFVRAGTPLRPIAHGGHQEKHRRAGTENVPGIVGLGRACQVAMSGLNNGAMTAIGGLRDHLETALTSLIPNARINGKAVPRVPNTANILFEHVGGDALVMALDELGIEVSRGSACSAGAADPSNVLMAMGLTGPQARSSLRFSLGKQNTAEQIDTAIPAIAAAVKDLSRKSAMFWTA